MTAETKNTMKHCIACELILPELEAQNDKLKLELEKAQSLIRKFISGADLLLRDLDCVGTGELSQALVEARNATHKQTQK